MERERERERLRAGESDFELCEAERPRFRGGVRARDDERRGLFGDLELDNERDCERPRGTRGSVAG